MAGPGLRRRSRVSGFGQAFAKDYNLDAITAILGKEFWCPDTVIKLTAVTPI